MKTVCNVGRTYSTFHVKPLPPHVYLLVIKGFNNAGVLELYLLLVHQHATLFLTDSDQLEKSVGNDNNYDVLSADGKHWLRQAREMRP